MYLNWGLAFRVRQNLKGSLWVVPVAGALAGTGLGVLVIDVRPDFTGLWNYSPSTADALLASIVGAAAALTGFVVTVSVLVVQIAVGSLSSRYMRLWFRDGLLKAVLAVLLGTLAFALQALRRVTSDSVPNFGVSVAAILLVVSLVVFLLFLDRALHRVRPVAVASLAAASVRRATDAAVNAAASHDAPSLVVGPYEAEAIPDLVVRCPKAGVVQAIDVRGLVRAARAADCLVVLRPRIGDFIPLGSSLFHVYGDPEAATSLGRRLPGMVALGAERTIDQDAGFGIRIMVDIANHALSPAVNDPTTAVQVIDHLGESLRMLGSVDVAIEPDQTDPKVGVIVPTRSWEEHVTLAVTEIREYGARSIQVNRRLLAMLEELRDAVSSERRPAIEEELRRLSASIAVQFAESVDLDRALQADPQGIGGRSGGHGSLDEAQAEAPDAL